MPRFRDDRGFTLTELVMAMSVMLIVMAVAGQIFYTAAQANSLAIEHASYAKRVTEPLDAASRNLMQATQLESAGAYSVTFLINPNLDTTIQRVTLDLSTPQGRLAIWNTDGQLANTTTVVDGALSQRLENAEAGITAFHYYDAAGQEITDYEAVPSRAKTLSITVHTHVSGEPVNETRQIYLRNMFGY